MRKGSRKLTGERNLKERRIETGCGGREFQARGGASMSAGSERSGRKTGCKVCIRGASLLTGCEILGTFLYLGSPVSLSIKLKSW